jgi:hypothetical protein
MIMGCVCSEASGGVYPRRVGRRVQPQRYLHMTVGCLLLFGLAMGVRAAGDDPDLNRSEPPVRLKKKMRLQPEPATDKRPESSPQKEPLPNRTEPPPRSGELKEDPEPSLQDSEEQIREITNRISKNMSQVEQRLQKNDPGDITQQTERDILHDLDQLIEQTRRQQQQVYSGRASRANSKNRKQQQKQPSGKPPPVQDRAVQNQSGNNARSGKAGHEDRSKLADLYKDVWGHLPETMRQEMDQYSREQFMAKYGDLLKQYYATIAEKGRRKGER